MKKIVYLIILLLVVSAGFYFLSKLSDNQKFEGIFINKEGSQDDSEKDVPEETGQQEDSQIDFSQLSAGILKQGTGPAVENGNTVSVHYAGYLEDGSKFDSSIDRGQPFSFTVGEGRVIPGWDLGLIGMKVGEIRRLYIPSEYGYGETGTPGGPIPPNANLIFEIELLAIQ